MIRKKHSHHATSTFSRSKPQAEPPLDVETIAVATLSVLARDAEKMADFLEITGLHVESLRTGAAADTLTPALLHHLMTEDALLIAVAQSLGQRPEAIAASVNRRIGPEQ